MFLVNPSNIYWCEAIKSRSFTLIEMLIVVGIVTIILTMALPAASKMWNHARVLNADHLITDMLQTAAQRSRMIQHPSYGVLFYVDERDRQILCFIKWRGYPDRIMKEERYMDVVDRFMIDVDNEWHFRMHSFIRIAPLDILNWTDEQIVNNDYRAVDDEGKAKKHRNTFVILFQNGQQCSLPVWIEDIDGDEDGAGDLTLLAVGDIENPETDSIVADMLIDEDDQMLEFYSEWGVLIYDEHLYQGFPEASQPQFIKKQYTKALLMDRRGHIVHGDDSLSH